MERFLQDLRFAVRTLAKSRGFTATAVVALALAIGVNTAMFSVVHSVLLKPLPYPDSDRLVWLNEDTPQLPGMSVAYPNYLDWKAQAKSFDSMAASQGTASVLTGMGEPEVVNGRNVSAEFFSTIGVRPALGRDFTAEDDREGANPVVIITDKFRRKHFGEQNPVGTAITLDHRVFTVVGVLAPGTRLVGLRETDVFTPIGCVLQGQDRTSRSDHAGTYVLARLKEGVSLAQARSELAGIAGRLAKEYPKSNANHGIAMTTMMDQFVGDVRPALLTLLAAVGCVLLVACANIANLVLARGTAREREIAIRMAVGARRNRIVRQLLTESIVLAGAGAVLGTALAFWTVKLVTHLATADLPRMRDVRVDSTVLLFTAVVSVFSAILFGLFPALHASATHVDSALKNARASAGPGRQRSRRALVVAEVAISLVLMAGAGLLIRSFVRLLNVDPGFNPRGLLIAEVSLPPYDEKDYPRISQFYSAVNEKLNQIPGVAAAGLDTPLPMSGSGWQSDYWIEGKPLPLAGEFPNSDTNYVSPEVFRAMGMQLKAGRSFGPQDTLGAPPVAIINEEFARRYWPGESALGKRVRLGSASQLAEPETRTSSWRTVVGVVTNVKQYALDQPIRDAIYIPMFQRPTGYANIVVRAQSGDPKALAGAVRAAVLAVDPNMPIANVSTMEEIMDSSLASRRLTVVLLGGFAALALLLAAIGIYGVMSYSVAQRTHEIGVRMALGATRTAVLQMVLREAGRLAAFGVALGLVLALASTQMIRRLLFGVGAADPLTFLVIAVLLAGVALLAALVPGRRATRVDPMVALRYE